MALGGGIPFEAAPPEPRRLRRLGWDQDARITAAENDLDEQDRNIAGLAASQRVMNRLLGGILAIAVSILVTLLTGMALIILERM